MKLLFCFLLGSLATLSAFAILFVRLMVLIFEPNPDYTPYGEVCSLGYELEN